MRKIMFLYTSLLCLKLYRYGFGREVFLDDEEFIQKKVDNVMNVAVMQPYFFPYMGYFNLMHACDVFISLDNVQYIDRGFINRNRVLVNGKPCTFTVPLKKASRKFLINEREVSSEFNKFCQKFISMLKHAYAGAVYLGPTLELVRAVIGSGESNVARLAILSVEAVCEYLGLSRKIVSASEIQSLQEQSSIKGEERIISLAQSVGGKCYINSIGGKDLYSKQNFHSADLKLRFVQPGLPQYDQRRPVFVAGLSIIDVLMHVARNQIVELLMEYDLIR